MSRATTTTSRPGSRRVLVLMDEVVVAEVINLTLNHGVYVTRGATNAAEAMALVDDWHPDLAVIDMDIAGDRFLTQSIPRNPMPPPECRCSG